METDTKAQMNEKSNLSGTNATPEHHELVQEKDESVSTPNGSDVEGQHINDTEGDGKVQWTFISVIATICLSGLYVGTFK
jgi:hypothetical protein